MQLAILSGKDSFILLRPFLEFYIIENLVPIVFLKVFHVKGIPHALAISTFSS